MFIDKNVIPHLMRNPVPSFLDSPVKPENDEYRCSSIRYLAALLRGRVLNLSGDNISENSRLH